VTEKGLPRSWVVFDACPKCGATVPRVTYISSPYEQKYLVFCNQEDSHRSEHFHVECWRCDFAWTSDMKGHRR